MPKLTPVAKSSMWLSEQKENIRNELVKMHPRPRQYLGYGGPFFKDLKKFFSIGCSVRSLEKNLAVYARQLKETAIYPGIHIRNEDFKEYVKGAIWKEAPIDVAYLDFQGCYSKSLEDSFKYLFSVNIKRGRTRRLNKGAIVAFTFGAARDGIRKLKDTYLFEKVCCRLMSLYRKDRKKAIATAITAIAQKAGRYRLKLVASKTYCNDDKLRGKRAKGMSMIFLAFKVVN